ncbi:MAG: HAMP domain-containing protein [Nitrospirae bacterium]|nr:HAMP domain-containing protein [Candidatus Manganitrophaceae bacterium]
MSLRKFNLKIRKFNLKIKFSILISTLLGLTLSLSYFITSGLMTESLTEEAMLRAISITQGIAQYSQEAILTRDRLALETMISEASKDPAILYIFLVDVKQNILAHTDLTQQGKPYFPPDNYSGQKEFKGGVELLTSHEADGKERLDLIAPILFTGQKRIGSVHVGFSKRPIYETVAQSQKKIGIFIFLALCVGLLGAWLLAYYIVKPIRRLVDGVKSITEGTYPQIEMKSNDEIGLLVSTFNEMSRNLREKELIKRAFSQYISENILETFLQNPRSLQLGGTRTEATILFTDIRGFTSLAERLDPPEVVHILNDYFAAVVEIVQKYEGTLDKFIGDAAMAVFGTPIRHDNDEERAVRAALEMNERFQLLKQKWVREGYPEIEIGIGINTGEVVAGNVGSLKRLAYTVIGNSVNMAARIEKLNKRYHTQILISSDTYKRLEGILEAIPLPPTRVRGKSEEIQVFVVVGFMTDARFDKKVDLDSEQYKLI